MKSSCLLALLLAVANTARAAEMTDWKNLQPVRVPQPGLHTLNLPAATLDAARPELGDLRLLDPNGREIPYLLQCVVPAPPLIRAAKKFEAALAAETTIITIQTGFDQPLQAVTLETQASNFIKPVQVEGSSDGVTWQTLTTGRPVFRHPKGAHQLTIGFAAAKWAFLRLTVDDRRSEPVPFTGATLHAATAADPPTESVPVTITERAETDGQTRLTLDLGAAHLTLAALQLECADLLFMRSVKLAVCDITEQGITERILTGGTIYRVGIEGQSSTAELSLPVERQLPYRELVLIIDNHSNPPLEISAVRATRRLCLLSFHAAQAGDWQLFVANPTVAAPHYDLAGLGANLKTEQAARISPGALVANPAYRPREVLPDIENLGSALDLSAWNYRKPVMISRGGIQQLELDLETLAHASASLSDLRLVRDGKQRPYVLDRTVRPQKVPLAMTVANDPRRPNISRWQLKLPHAALPISKLTCASPSGLFQRDFALYEQPTDRRGESYQRPLGAGSWTRTPSAPQRPFEMTLTASPATDTLWLETDNRDNPPIELEKGAAYCPVIRLWFKSPATPATFLYYGNPQAGAPQYDIALVAPQLLAAERVPALLGPAEKLQPLRWAERTGTSRSRNLIFWGALALVVVVLLVLVMKFLPKEPPPPTK